MSNSVYLSDYCTHKIASLSRKIRVIACMQVSIIFTVKNEEETVRPLLDSILAQSRLPDEVVVCDGGSVDRTLSVLDDYRQRLPLKIVVAPGSNISQGRNRAIEVAVGSVIAATDGGVVLDSEWLAELIQPIEEDGAVVVSGWFKPDPQTDFEVVLGATILPHRSDVEPERFLPSSRSVAYLKSAWEAVGGYPEWLDFGEDLIFDLALRERYGPFPMADRAVAFYRPRGSLGAFARQYYRYARGDGKANLWPKRHAIRYLTYLVGLPALLFLAKSRKRLGLGLLSLGAGIYCRRPVERLRPAISTWPLFSRLRALALIPIIRLVGDLAKMIGYPPGFWWRRRHRANDKWGTFREPDSS